MSETTDQVVRCRDQCGAAVADQETAEQAGWAYLQISSGWRCGRCAGALLAAAKIVGADRVSGDSLPPTSRGSLPRETASTITPPAVRG